MARILVAEDDTHVRELIDIILSREGHEVLTAADGQEALEAYQQAEFDLVCVDLDMPRLNGIGVTQAVRSAGSTDVPILMITASATPVDVADAHRAGITAMLGKPFLPSHLRDQVAVLLRDVGRGAAGDG